MKHGLVMLVVIMILKDTATFKVLFIVSVLIIFIHQLDGRLIVIMKVNLTNF